MSRQPSWAGFPRLSGGPRGQVISERPGCRVQKRSRYACRQTGRETPSRQGSGLTSLGQELSPPPAVLTKCLHEAIQGPGAASLAAIGPRPCPGSCRPLRELVAARQLPSGSSVPRCFFPALGEGVSSPLCLGRGHLRARFLHQGMGPLRPGHHSYPPRCWRAWKPLPGRGVMGEVRGAPVLAQL